MNRNLLRDPNRRRWLVAVTVVVAFALGLYGYLLEHEMSGRTAVYNTFGLFTLGYTEPGDKQPSVYLEIARFLAPIATVAAVIGVVVAVCRDQLDVFWIWLFRWRRHVVICGLGRMGTATALRLTKQYRVVAIERDPSCPNIKTARQHGVRVVVGDASYGNVREHARVEHCCWFIWSPSEWFEGEAVVDGLRRELTKAARHRKPGDDDTPAALIRVRNLGLCSSFRCDVLVHETDESSVNLDTDFFNVSENAAQRVLWTTTRSFVTAGTEQFELWMLGGGSFAEAMFVQAARNWWGNEIRPELTIRVFAEDAQEVADLVEARWPEVGAAAQIVVHSGPPERALDPRGPLADGPPRGVFIAIDDEEDALHLGRRFMDETAVERIAVRATMRYPPVSGDGRMLFFDGVAYGLDSDAVIFDTYELLGRMIHEHHILRQRVRADGSLVTDTDPHGIGHEWSHLDKLWKDSNRAAARRVVPILQQAGFDVVGLGVGDVTPGRVVPTLTPDQVECLARAEHERWCAFMTDRGWKCGPEYDNLQKTRPALTDWDLAPEHDRETTRSQVAEYPRLLAQLGFRVVPPADRATELRDAELHVDRAGAD